MNKLPPSTTKQPQITEEQWDVVLDKVVELYKTQNRTWKQTQAAMYQDYGFYASESQYKGMFAKRKILKKIRTEKLIQIWLRDGPRRLQGKDTEYKVYGVEPPRERLVRIEAEIRKVVYSPNISGFDYHTIGERAPSTLELEDDHIDLDWTYPVNQIAHHFEAERAALDKNVDDSEILAWYRASDMAYPTTHSEVDWSFPDLELYWDTYGRACEMLQDTPMNGEDEWWNAGFDPSDGRAMIDGMYFSPE